MCDLHQTRDVVIILLHSGDTALTCLHRYGLALRVLYGLPGLPLVKVGETPCMSSAGSQQDRHGCAGAGRDL